MKLFKADIQARLFKGDIQARLFKGDIQGRLKRRDLQINEEELEIIDSFIGKRFASDMLEIPDAISMFDFEKNLTNLHQIKSCDELEMFC